METSQNVLPEVLAQETHEMSPLEITAQEIGVSVEEIIEMENALVKKVNALPAFPKTIIEIERLKNSEEQSIDSLLKIISSDNSTTANLLKIANSALYGFNGKIKDARTALSMLGFDKWVAIALSNAINKILEPNLLPYEVDIDSFATISSTQSKIIELWNDPELKPIKKDLQIAAFLQEVGKIIVSKIIIERKLVHNFQRKLVDAKDIANLEEKTIYKSSAQITSMVFRYWKLNKKMIDLIEHSDKPESAPEDIRKWAMALKIVKTLCPVIKESWSQRDIERAVQLWEKYGFDKTSLENMIISAIKLIELLQEQKKSV